jgi:hypothetical protein
MKKPYSKIQINLPEDHDPDREELELLAEQAFLRTLQAWANCSDKKFRAAQALAQGLAKFIGLVYAGKGTRGLAADISAVIRDMAISCELLPEEHRKAILEKAFVTLNTEALEKGKAKLN